MSTRTVWTGTYREKSGRVTHAIIRVDPDKLSDYFCTARRANSAFTKAHETGKARTTRLGGGIIMDLTPVTDWERDTEDEDSRR